ncbi:protein SSUH2 homolog [Lingula anatina]|uniref:Protein SSUH2 homolog n=1 Tax=Lingula anatina TaxID=7574 RepID=A0A1S3HGI8_LINAN|nr:protein SSUH2 homolog [Lingula anatina]|eukprot:XP_013384139.1 protein SSUH2 homolog [Lingula anatina]
MSMMAQQQHQGYGPGQPQPPYPQGSLAAPGGAPPGQQGPDQAAAATAPPLEKMDHVAGYENVGFNAAAAPPPAYADAVAQGPPPERRDIQNVPVITEEQAREAMLQYVAEHCCYGSGTAKEMVFRDLQSSSAFHYTLETFTEKRQTSWAYEPYIGQPIDGPHNGPAPGPWDIQVQPPTKFKTQHSHVEVPHTASVKPCHDCIGNGRVRCHHCHGCGHSRCHHCHGHGTVERYEDGHHHHHTCHVCHGSGNARCHVCHGHGQVPCRTCDAKGNLKCFIRLTITWTNNMNDHIVERTSLPDELIRSVTGQVAFEEELPRVWPINHFPDATINQASQQLVERHNTQFQMERILLQRHQVRIIPVTESLYTWKGKDYNFFVYGFENKVWTSNYPQSCCCGCTIL